MRVITVINIQMETAAVFITPNKGRQCPLESQKQGPTACSETWLRLLSSERVTPGLPGISQVIRPFSTRSPSSTFSLWPYVVVCFLKFPSTFQGAPDTVVVTGHFADQAFHGKRPFQVPAFQKSVLAPRPASAPLPRTCPSSVILTLPGALSSVQGEHNYSSVPWPAELIGHAGSRLHPLWAGVWGR